MSIESEAQSLIEKLKSKLPDVIYDNMEGESILWQHNHQRNQTARRFAIFTVEQEIKVLEAVRGENVSFHNGRETIPVEYRIKELHNLINHIKEL